MSGSNLGALLRAKRRRSIDPNTGSSYTQLNLADAVGVSRETISALETGAIQMPSPEIAIKLCAVLGLDMLEVVNAMGYRVSFEGLADEEEVVVAQAFHVASELERSLVRQVLHLGDAPPLLGRGR